MNKLFNIVSFKVLLTTIICVIFTGLLYSNYTPSNVRTVYKKLWLSIDYQAMPNIYVTSDKLVTSKLALTDVKGVHVSTFLLSLIKNDNELALILGHESAHARGIRNEDEADLIGAEYANKAGFNVCQGREVMLRIVKAIGDSHTSKYSSWQVRYNNLNKYCK